MYLFGMEGTCITQNVSKFFNRLDKVGLKWKAV